MINFVGSGKAAHFFATALRMAGEEIGMVSSPNRLHAQQFADKFGCKATDDLARLSHADIYIICVKDDALEHVISSLCPLHPNALFVHTAGSMPIEVFRGKAQRFGVIYPLQTLSKDFAPADISEVPIYVEASDAQTLSTITALAQKFASRVRPLDSEHRKYLHLSAVFACNFANHCYAIAEQYMQQAGCPFSDLFPLIGKTATKVKSLSPEKAQTGPAVRYDSNVIERHESLIADDLVRDIYRLMSLSIHQTAEKHTLHKP